MRIFYAVDCQKDFMDKDGALYVLDADGIRDNIERLCIEGARDEDIRIWASVDWHEEDDVEFKTFPKHCVKHSVGSEIIQEVSQFLLLVIPKISYDVFAEPHIKRLIEFYDITEVVVFGVATDICVKAAVLGFIKNDVRVLVAEDAIKGVFPDKTADAIKDMKNAGAIFMKTKDIVGE